MAERPVALVTGASAGIGRATAKKLAAAGWRVIVSARLLPLDVTDAAAHEAAIAGLPESWAAVEVAVLNAGLALNMVPVWENSADEIDRMVDTNVKGVLHGIRAVVPGMLARGKGHVVTIGSTAGHGVYAGGVVYCATKHALLALTEGLKIDAHGTPLRVTAVSPGLTETEFSRVRFEGDDARAAPVYADTVPLTADDVAEAVLYAVQAPPRVNVREVLVTPRVQSGLSMIARGGARDAGAAPGVVAAEPLRKG